MTDDVRYARLEPAEDRRLEEYPRTSSMSEETLIRAYGGLGASATIPSPTVPPRGGRLDEEIPDDGTLGEWSPARPTGLVAVGSSPELER